MWQELEAGLGGEARAFWTLVLVQLWELPWKSVALWRAARNKHLGWFITLVLVHIAGLIDIIYIFYFSEPKKKIVARFQRKEKGRGEN